jgi:hypothetical protein
MEAELDKENSADENDVDEADDVAAVTLPSFVLGGKEGDEDSDDYSVSVDCPISVPHMFWKATALGDEGFPVSVNALLDCGAHVVLIRPSTAKRLGLTPRKLRKPVPIDVAIDDKKGKVPSVMLDSFVSLSLSSADFFWTSKPVKAIIAPGLCTSVLLGLPFLTHNGIVCDFERRTACIKGIEPEYDLLNPRVIERAKAKPRQDKKSLTRMIPTVLKHRKEMIKELKWRCAARLRQLEEEEHFEKVKPFNVVAAIRNTIANLAEEERYIEMRKQIKEEFKDLFEPIAHIEELPENVYAKIELLNPKKIIYARQYSCPRRYRESFKKLLDKRLHAGFISPSSSPHASPSFIIPKADPAVLPRWVNDYRQLNANVVPDNFCLPRVEDILADCAKGTMWSTLDMTDAFFQTRVHPDDVHKTTVTTPWGNYQWHVMPMGFRNAPAIHQRRITQALHNYLGKICHVFMDDSVVWSSPEEHMQSIRKVLQKLREAGLRLNEKKCNFFCTQVKYLGHRISRNGIEACEGKAEKIQCWPVPKSATQVRGFLGIVRYLSSFLPKLAEQTRILDELTTRDADKKFPEWTQQHQDAFDAIKTIVASRDCLTTIDHKALDENNIYVTSDASDKCSGAVLSFGPTWERARPVAYDSMTFKNAELNYPVHEKELLAILRALRKWRVDLLGSPFFVYTDHKTLLNFERQRDLSRRQIRWMEELAIFDCKFVYIRGEDNTVADALSRLPYEYVSTTETEEAQSVAKYPLAYEQGERIQILDDDETSPKNVVAALTKVPPRSIFKIDVDQELLTRIREAYNGDPWCKKLEVASEGMTNLQKIDGLWFIGDRLVVPKGCGLPELIFRAAHDALGHFGFHKTYESIRESYYWPNMRKQLENIYIPSCPECQRNKDSVRKASGPLHPLPVPDARFRSVAMDFIGPLPDDNGFNCILTMTDRLGADVQIIPTRTDLSAEGSAVLFFDNWYCENGLPDEIISDRDKLFLSKFWKRLHELTGVKLKMSTTAHPQSDGSSERTNRTVNQCLRFHVERNQKNWVKALPRVRFALMNTVNKSTGLAPFELKSGHRPRVIPALTTAETSPYLKWDPLELLQQIQLNVGDAKDNLLLAKVTQAYQANATRSPEIDLNVDEYAMLSTLHRRRELKKKNEKRVAKFMPRYDGPYKIIATNPPMSTYTLEIPKSPNGFNTFHVSQLRKYVPNDDDLFPSRRLERPPSVLVNGVEEYWVEKIVDAKRCGKGWRYLVRWTGYGPEEDRWIAGKELDDNEAVDRWWQENGGTSSSITYCR